MIKREVLENMVISNYNVYLGFCKKILGNEIEAQDALSDSILKMMKGYTSLTTTEEKGVEAWIYRILNNTSLDYIRNKKPTLSLDQLDYEPFPSKSPYSDVNTNIDIQNALNNLPIDYRTPFLLYEVRGKTVKESAEFLDCPVGTFRSRTSRARAALRGLLGKDYSFA